MMKNALLNYNQTTAGTMEEHSIEELMESYMMYKIGRYIFIVGQVQIKRVFPILVLKLGEFI